MKLSICIPTYNRSTNLRELLKTIYGQLELYALFDKIEVVVSDNCSPDDTREVVAEFFDRGLKYSRNETNIGPDANFLKLFELARGEYIWLPGDDDLYHHDTLDYIVKMIELHRFDYFFLRVAGPRPYGERGAQVLSKHELMSRASIFTSFMTSQLIRADLIKGKVPESRKHLGGFMAYYTIFLAALYESEKCIVSDYAEIYAGSPENTGGYKFYKVWAVAAVNAFKECGFGADPRLLNKFKWDMLWSLLLPITYRTQKNRSGYSFEKENPLESLMVNFSDRKFSILWRPYFWLPRVPLFLLHGMVTVCARIRRRISRPIV